MSSITIKNIPTDIYERLKYLARVNRRSVNSQIIRIIEEAVQSKPIDPEKFIANA